MQNNSTEFEKKFFGPWEKVDFRTKIDFLLSALMVKLWKLAEESGLGSTLEKAYSENREMRKSTTDKFLQKIGISRDWWDHGKGDPFTKDMDIRRFANLDEDEPRRAPKIPFYDVIAVGGSSIMLHDQEAVSGVSEMIDPGTFLRAATGALRVYGHSMYPKYPAGCIVAFKASSKPIPEVIVWGEDYVIELEDRRIIKKIDKGDSKEYIKAVSLNGTNGEKPKYQFDTIDIPLSAVKRMYMVLGKIELEASM